MADKEKRIWIGEQAPLWADEQEKADWFADALWEDPDFPHEVKEHREKALVNLYAILSHYEYREVLWGDHNVRKALLSSGEPAQDTVIRTLCAGCLVKLSVPKANRKAMINDDETRKILGKCAAKEAPEELKLRTYLVLANLCLQLRGSEDTPMGQQLIRSLVLGLDQKQHQEVRTRAAGALWSMASSSADLRAMWQNVDIRYAVVACVSPEEENENVRSNLLAVLWSLAVEETNREPMWRDEGVRLALLASASPDQPSKTRVNGLNALRTLAVNITVLQRRIWKTEEVRVLLLQAASIGQPADVRASAMQVLIQLSFHARNAREMVEMGVRDMLYQAAEDEQLDASERRKCWFGAERLEDAQKRILIEPASEAEEETAAPEGEEETDAAEGAAPEGGAAPEAVVGEPPGDRAEADASDPGYPPVAGGTLQTGVLDRAAEHRAGDPWGADPQ